MLKTKSLKASAKAKVMPPDPEAGAKLAQLKFYEEALKYFQQQKFQRAKQELEKVIAGPSKELADRARVHLKIAEQRMKPTQEHNPRGAEDHYQRGVAMMNIGRWDEARGQPDGRHQDHDGPDQEPPMEPRRQHRLRTGNRGRD